MILSAKKFILVFGSNLAGRHGMGAAKTAALHFGAKYGVGEGLSGNSYGIPTKDKEMGVLSLDRIKVSVDEFIQFSEGTKSNFVVTRVGCGLAKYQDEDIAPFFANAGTNVHLPDVWNEILNRKQSSFILLNDANIPVNTFKLIEENFTDTRCAFNNPLKPVYEKKDVSAARVERRFRP